MKKTGHNIWLWITIIAVSMIFFLFVGEHNQVMQKDSQVYISWIYTRGVMPIYPLFIEMLKLLFGEVNYLYAAVVIQGIISVVCSIDFCLFIKKQFKLHDIEFFIIFLLSLLVYTIEAPEVINNHFILTESLTYPLFYIYMKYLLRGLLNASRKDMYINWIWALILSLIRSQLQLLWAVSAVVFAWLHLKRYWTKHTSHKCSMVLWHLGIAAILMGVITLGGYKFVSTSVSVYRQVLFGNERATDYQGVYAFWDRISYTMDREDADLFEDEQTKEIFLEVYEAIDDAKLRYPYRPKNLWTWEHVATAAAKNGHLAGDAIYSYMERNMDIEESQKRIVEAKVMQEMSTTLMKKHWDRYLYYSLCMMPQGFVSTIFMQKEAFYTLCHVITFGLYAAAFVLAVRCIRKRELSSPAGEMMLYTIAVAVMLVCITNIVFMGLQRYMYYMYGVFYIAFFLALRENFKNIIKLR